MSEDRFPNRVCSGGERPDREGVQAPIGCQMVFSSRKPAISQGL